MALMPTETGSSLDGRERRICARHQVKSLAYFDIGADNGGIVLNISEGGVAVHAVSVLPPGPLIDLRLQLPRSSKRLETKGKVAWTSSTKKEAGVEFIGLTDEVRLEIREWLALENLEPVYLERAPAAALPTQRPVRKDKWTSLVSEWTSVPKGIERVTDDRTVSTRPVTVAESVPREEMVTPATGPNAAAASEGPVASRQARDYGLAEPLMAPESAPNAESNSIANPHVIDSAFSPNPGVIGNLEHRKNDAELSLPSDKLLTSSLHPISIIPSRGNTDNSKGSRNLREAGSDAANDDDFLKKARALFEPQHLHEASPEVNDSASSLESVETAPAELPSANGSTQEHGPAPMSDLIATSKPSIDPVISNVLRPVTSLSLEPDAPHGNEAKHSSDALPSARNLHLRSLLTILALCLLLSVVCLAMGLVVGRSLGTHSPHSVASRNDVSGQPVQIAASQGQTSPSSNQPTLAPAMSHDPKQPQNRELAPGQRSPIEATSHRKPSALRPSESSLASSAGATNDPAENATQPQDPAGGGTSVSPAENVSSTGVPTAPAPAPSLTPSAPEFHVTPAPEPKAVPHSPPPSERVVSAYLIYRVEPIYPRTALGIEGTVKIHATVGRDGIVKNLKVVSGPPPLTAAAIDAAQYWRYIPALRNGEPVETETDISIEFHRPR